MDAPNYAAGNAFFRLGKWWRGAEDNQKWQGCGSGKARTRQAGFSL